MHFEQKADFEIKPADRVMIKKNNLAATPATNILSSSGRISQAALAAFYGESPLKIENIFTVQQVRNGQVIHSEEICNAVVDAALDSMLDTYFGAEAKKAAWHLGLIDATGFTAVAQADSMASHAGWSEFVTYDEAGRQVWTPITASGQSITGTAVSEFTIGTVASQEIQGLFVTDNLTKGGTVGFLWSTALFSAPAGVKTADTFRVTYTLRLGN